MHYIIPYNDNNNHDISALSYNPSSGISALQNITFSARTRRILNYRTRDLSLGMRAHYIPLPRHCQVSEKLIYPTWASMPTEKQGIYKASQKNLLME